MEKEQMLTRINMVLKDRKGKLQMQGPHSNRMQAPGTNGSQDTPHQILINSKRGLHLKAGPAEMGVHVTHQSCHHHLS